MILIKFIKEKVEKEVFWIDIRICTFLKINMYEFKNISGVPISNQLFQWQHKNQFILY